MLVLAELELHHNASVWRSSAPTGGEGFARSLDGLRPASSVRARPCSPAPWSARPWCSQRLLCHACVYGAADFGRYGAAASVESVLVVVAVLRLDRAINVVDTEEEAASVAGAATTIAIVVAAQAEPCSWPRRSKARSSTGRSASGWPSPSARRSSPMPAGSATSSLPSGGGATARSASGRRSSVPGNPVRSSLAAPLGGSEGLLAGWSVGRALGWLFTSGRRGRAVARAAGSGRPAGADRAGGPASLCWSSCRRRSSTSAACRRRSSSSPPPSAQRPPGFSSWRAGSSCSPPSSWRSRPRALHGRGWCRWRSSRHRSHAARHAGADRRRRRGDRRVGDRHGTADRRAGSR